MAGLCRPIIFFALAAFVAAAREDPAEEGTGSPVDKVVGLLTELKSKLEADGKNEQAVFDKYACWCEETTSRKAAAVEESMAKITQLGTTVLSLKGKVNVLASEIKDLQRDTKDNEKAQAKQTKIREDGNKRFLEEKGEMEDTIGALEKGIQVLQGAGTKTALLEGKAQLQSSMKVLKKTVASLPSHGALSPVQLKHLQEFLQDPGEYYDKKAAKSAAYSPASSTITGILKDMYDTFVQNLEKTTLSESDAAQQFEQIMEVKAKELASLQADTKAKTSEKAEAEIMLADASQELADTSKLMKADSRFFDETKAACSTKADEWSERVRARSEELAGIAKAIETLTSDDAKALFSKAIKPGKETMLLQVGTSAVKPTEKAIEALTRHAKKSKSLRLAKLAAQLKKGPFDLVIPQIDKMEAVLKQEEKDDFAQKDWCKAETFKNEEEASKYEYKVQKKSTKVDALENSIISMEATVKQSVEEMEDTMKEIAGLEDERKESHQAFKDAKADDEAAIKLLEQAIESLSAFYGNNKGAEMGEVQGSVNFLQEGESKEDPLKGEDDAPEADFSDKGSRKGESKGIVSILTMLKEDLEDEVKNGGKEEEAAQVEYEMAVKKAKATIESLKARQTNLKASIATAEESVEEAKKQGQEFAELKTADEEYIAEIKPDCDWMLENIEARREARAEELEGLHEAKAFLQGAAPAFVQVSTVTSFLAKH